MPDLYCTPGDVYANGLPRGAVPNPGRLAESSLAATNVLTLDVHGFELNDPVSFRAKGGGALPAPLVEGASYFAIPLTESTFQVSATAGGSAIDLTTDGDNVMVIAPLPMANAIVFASRVLDDMLPDHVVPLTAPYPPIITMTAGELAAGKLAPRAGVTSVSLTAILDAASKRIARWAAGVPVRGTNTQPRAGLATSAAASSARRDWDRFGGTG